MRKNSKNEVEKARAEETPLYNDTHPAYEDAADTYILKDLHRILDIPAKRQIIAIGTYHRDSDGTIDGLEFKVLKNGVRV